MSAMEIYCDVERVLLVKKLRLPEIIPHMYGHLIFDNIQYSNIQYLKIFNGEKTVSLKCWENWSTTYKRMKLEHFLTPYTKINLKWIKDMCKTRNYKTLRGKHRQNT